MIFPKPELKQEEQARSKPMPGAHTRLSRNFAGHSIAASLFNGWKHPWYTQALWDAVHQQWTATVKPGFVNGNCPYGETRVTNVVPKSNLDFGINPLNGQPFFSSYIFNQTQQNGPGVQTVAIQLVYGPQLILTYRNVGWDGDSIPPAFFKNLGVSNPKPQPTAEDIENANADVLYAQPPGGNRLLRACDIVLHQSRQALTSSTTVNASALATGQAAVSQTLSVINPSTGDFLKVYPTPQMGTPVLAGIDPTNSDYTEQSYDEIRVSTVWLLSPPDTALDSSPDVTWRPYVQHNLFWDLNWSQPAFQVRPPQPELPNTGAEYFAGGAAASIINTFTSTINTAWQDAQNVLDAYSLAGYFWTPTGGGSDSAYPVVTTQAKAASGSGLDKDGILLAQRKAKALVLITATLDPAFPYHSPMFPTALLT